MHLKLNITFPTKIPLEFYAFQQSDDSEIYAAWLLRSGENTAERKMAMQLVKVFPFWTVYSLTVLTHERNHTIVRSEVYNRIKILSGTYNIRHIRPNMKYFVPS
jgi:hypothetical protein